MEVTVGGGAERRRLGFCKAFWMERVRGRDFACAWVGDSVGVEGIFVMGWCMLSERVDEGKGHLKRVEGRRGTGFEFVGSAALRGVERTEPEVGGFEGWDITVLAGIRDKLDLRADVI